MTFQPSVAQYFNSRKRQAVDEVKNVTHQNKVLLLESRSGDLSNVKTADDSQKLGDTAIPNRIVYVDDKKIEKFSTKFKNRNSVKKKTTNFKSVVKASQEHKTNGIQMDIRKTFLNGTKHGEVTNDVAKETEEVGEPSTEREVMCLAVYTYILKMI